MEWLTGLSGVELAGCIFVVAMLYAAVGHGGASGYLAVLSFTALSPQEMSATALVLNLIVSLLAFQAYYRARYFSLSLIWPFLATSIPAAFLGGVIPVESHTYYLLLAGILLFAAYRMALPGDLTNRSVETQCPTRPVALGCGAGIGLLSGIVGVGGGIFLSPLMMIRGWADAKQTAAASSFFIFANSLAGLGGRWAQGELAVGSHWILIFAGVFGGFLGAEFGAKRLSVTWFRRVLALVLVIAAFKMILQSA